MADKWLADYRRRISARGFDADYAVRVFAAIHSRNSSARAAADHDADFMQTEQDAADDYEDRKARL